MEQVDIEDASVAKNSSKKNQIKIKFWRKGIPLWIVIFLWTLAPILIVAIGITAIIYTQGQSQVNSMYEELHTSIQDSIHTYFTQYINSMKMTAESAQKLEPRWITETMPTDGSYYPQSLLGLMNTFDTDQFLLESMGLLSRNENGSKLTWELARGFGCPEYIFGTLVESTRPLYIGHCASTNGTINPAISYSGLDWGLKPVELDVMEGKIGATFEPIFALLGKFTLTYLVGKPSVTRPGTIYGLSFAEKSLALIDNYFASLTVGDTGVGYVVERDTGLIVTASVLGQSTTTAPDNSTQRVHCVNATNSLISRSAKILLSKHASSDAPYSFVNLQNRQDLEEDDLLINIDQFVDTGLDWLIILAIPRSDFFAKIKTSSELSIGLAAVVIVVGCALTFAWTRLITRPLNVIKTNMEKIALLQFNEMEAPQESSFSEIRDIQESYNQLHEGLKTLNSK